MNELNGAESPSRLGEKVLSIELTTYCNIECRHCFVNHQINERSSLSFDIVKAVIREGHAAGYRRLHFTGGEPLVWEKLFEALDYAFFMGYQTVLINTNGTLLSKEVCAEFAKYAGVSITVSLDGPQELHDFIRGAGSYRRTMRGIEIAVNQAVEPIIFTSVYKRLLPELPYYAEHIYGKFPEIKYLSLIPLRKASENGFTLSPELLDPEDFLRLVRVVSFLNVLGFKIDVLNEPLVRVASKMLQCHYMRWSQPLRQEGSIIIMANGRMSTSHFSRIFLGFYEPGLLKKVLASEEYGMAVSLNKTVCISCEYNHACRENGMVHPSELISDFCQNELYCRSVLDIIRQEKSMCFV